MKGKRFDTRVLVNGGPDPEATKSCPHKRLKRALVTMGPFPGSWTWVEVQGWTCVACGADFAPLR